LPKIQIVDLCHDCFTGKKPLDVDGHAPEHHMLGFQIPVPQTLATRLDGEAKGIIQSGVLPHVNTEYENQGQDQDQEQEQNQDETAAPAPAPAPAPAEGEKAGDPSSKCFPTK
jgi:hypothetical protein